MSSKEIQNSKGETPELSDAEFRRFARESEARRAREPFAESARYDASTRRLCLELRGGVIVQVPLDTLRGFENATEAQRANLVVRDGRTLWWNELDEQIELPILLGRALNIQSIHEVARKAGRVRSAAKAVSSRANGAKGGRPRRDSVAA